VNAIADDECPGARKVPQGVQRALGSLLLDDGDGHDHEHETDQHQGIGRLAHEQVDDSRGNEHEEHGLAHDPETDGQQTALLLGGKFVGSLLRQRAFASPSLSPGRPARSRTELAPRVPFASLLRVFLILSAHVSSRKCQANEFLNSY
jgi:hypothetical protein